MNGTLSSALEVPGRSRIADAISAPATRRRIAFDIPDIRHSLPSNVALVTYFLWQRILPRGPTRDVNGATSHVIIDVTLVLRCPRHDNSLDERHAVVKHDADDGQQHERRKRQRRA